jgi:NDP-sugar pyrophosphorylase family protein
MINIVVPMAGHGSRLAALGDGLPKPLIEVSPGRRMIEFVIDALTLEEPHRFIFVCLAEHDRRFGIGALLCDLAPGAEIVLANGVTTGPAETVLLARPLIDNDDELLVSYCDSFLEIDMAFHLAAIRKRGVDGGLFVYPSRDPMESYAVLDPSGAVLRTAEKVRISDHATAGLYYFRQGSAYVSAAATRIAKDAASAVEPFVCPVYNELIDAGLHVAAWPIDRARNVEMGTAGDLAEARLYLRGRPSGKSEAEEGLRA